MNVLLFDGVCNLCNRWVLFVIDRDPGQCFTFAPLQSEAGGQLLAQHGRSAAELSSLVLVEAGAVYDRSTAVLRVVRRLSWPWPLLYVLMIVPRALRDRVYDLIARRRYRWFGRTDACRIPTPETRRRFLDAAPAVEGPVDG